MGWYDKAWSRARPFRQGRGGLPAVHEVRSLQRRGQVRRKCWRHALPGGRQDSDQSVERLSGRYRL